MKLFFSIHSIRLSTLRLWLLSGSKKIIYNIIYGGSLVLRPFKEEEEKWPGTHCTCMCHGGPQKNVG